MIIYSRDDLDDLQTLTSLKLHLKKLKNEFRTNYKNEKYKQWKKEELDFIVENWGKVTPYEMMQKFKVTKSQLIKQIHELGLKNWLLYSKYITLCNLFGFKDSKRSKSKNTYSNFQWYSRFLKMYNAPIEKVSVWNVRSVTVIELDKFYEWFKDKIHLMDFYYTDVKFFKNAPEWFKEKLKADSMAYEYCKKRLWTKEEEEKIVEMINAGCGYREISIALKRTGGALKRHFTDIKLKIRPKKAYNQIEWTQEEIDKLKDLYLKGYKPCVIQEYMDRSDLAINAILERYDYFGQQFMRFSK